MFEHRLINPIFSHSIITEPARVIWLLEEEPHGTVLSWAPRNLLCSADDTSSLPVQAYLSSLNYQETHPRTYRATGCSKLLFLWEMIKEMLPYVQILNCLVHELRSRAVAL